MKQLISIIVPVYRVEPYLDTCVASIVRQTYQNLEIILVDDGSPDNCPQLCDAWAAKDSRIRVIHKKNGGSSSARNAGLDIARGNYIGFVDSDDMIRPDMYALLMQALSQSEKKIACCYDGWKPGVPYDGGCVPMRDVGVEETLNGIFNGQVGTSVWRRLYHRSVWENLRFPEGETNEDFPILIPTTVAAGGMVHVCARLYYYRPSPSSITSTYWKTDGEIVLKNLERMQLQIAQNDLDCMPSFRQFRIKSVFSCALAFEKNLPDLNKKCLENRKKYLRILGSDFFFVMKQSFLKRKDKLLYLMILTHTLRPAYKLLGKL